MMWFRIFADAPNAFQSCSFDKVDPSFLLFPRWYEYLSGIYDANGVCTPQLSGINDIWLVVAAVIEILLRVAAIVAMAMVIYGGILYATSQGSPDQTSKAKSTILNAIVGLVIAIGAAVIVSFIAGSIS
jgi:hypothetical protein